MKQSNLCKKIPNTLLSLGLAAGLSLSSGIAAAEGQIAIVSNDTVIESGEEFGATLVLSGDGNYDVYVGLVGGILDKDSIYAIDSSVTLIKWVPPELPAKFRDNVDIGSLTVDGRIISVFPRINVAEFPGTYTFYAALSTVGQLDFPVIDVLEVTVKSE